MEDLSLKLKAQLCMFSWWFSERVKVFLLSISFTFVPQGFCLFLQLPNLAVLLKVWSARLSHTHLRKRLLLFSWQPFNIQLLLASCLWEHTAVWFSHQAGKLWGPDLSPWQAMCGQENPHKAFVMLIPVSEPFVSFGLLMEWRHNRVCKLTVKFLPPYLIGLY